MKTDAQDTHSPAETGSLELLKRLFFENYKKYQWGYLATFVLMAVVATTTGLSAWIMKDVINEIFVERKSGMIMPIAGIVMAIFIIKGLATYAHMLIMNRIGNNIVATSQKRLYDNILEQGLDFYGRYPMGELTTRMTHNAQAARNVLNAMVLSLGRDLFSLIGLITVMIIQDPLMAFGALVIMPIAVVSVGKLVRRVRSIAKQEFVSLAKIVSNIQETSKGIRVIKAFSLEDHMRAHTYGAIETVEKRANKIAQITARTSPIMETLGGFAIAGVIAYGGFRVLHQNQNPGAFFSFITALLLAYEPAKRLARLNVTLESGLVGVRLLYEMLDLPRTITEAPDAAVLHIDKGRVAFEKVTFAYDEQRVLNGLDMAFPAGSITALVGPSGGGKSTIFALIERFYDPDNGRVLIDGQNVKECSFKSLRQHIALVTQDTFLFDGTISENIAMGRAGVSEGEIKAAAKSANAHEFIENFPKGYDSQVGEGGDRLSGGQRQRIAIARAMIRDAPILLLDEATSSLDSESESMVQEALNHLMEGRTTIVIAHRLSTVRHADIIHVIDKGKLVQSGSHKELISKGGLYAHLYNLQFKEDTAPAA